MEKTAIILAGGKSSRMGEDKGLMLLNGIPMIQHIITVAKGVADHIIIVSNNQLYDQFGYPLFMDEIPQKGPLGGIYTGLLHSKTEFNLFLSCDIPYINVNLLNYLISRSSDHDISIIEKDGITHQLIGVIKRSCLAKIKQALLQDQLKLKSVFNTFNLNVVDANFFSNRLFTNINCKDDIKV